MPAEKESGSRSSDAEHRLQGLSQQAARHDLGALEIGVRQEHGELVAADAECPIRLAQRAGRAARRTRAATRSPPAWPRPSLICLELVEVDQEQSASGTS